MTMKTRNRQLDAQALGDHIDRLYRAARCLCSSRQEAEELVHETFAQVGKKPRRPAAEHDLLYLLNVLRKTFIARAAAGRPEILPQPDVMELVEDATVSPLEHRLDPGHVYRVIGALPPDLRDAVTAVDVVGLSRREGAKALCVSEATIATRLHHGRQRIALTLSEWGSRRPSPARVGPNADHIEYAAQTRDDQSNVLAVLSELR